MRTLATSPTQDEHDWERYLHTLEALDFLLLEQVYVVEDAPMDLTLLQRRLHYLNLSGRTVSRHVDRLAELGLLARVVSCHVYVNPVPALRRNATTLVRIWRIRQERSVNASHASLAAYGPGVR